MPRRYRKKARKPRVSKAVKRYVKKELRTEGELKRYNILFANAESVSTTVVTHSDFQQVGQGDDNHERIGTEVNAVGILISGSITSGDDSNILRFTGYLRDDDSTSITTPATVLAPITADYHSKVDRHLFDRKLVLNNSFSGAGKQRLFKIWIPLRRKVRWPDGTTGDPSKGHFHMRVVSDSAAATHPTITAWAQFMYRDP